MIKKLFLWLFCKPMYKQKQDNHVAKPSKIKDIFEIGAESIVNYHKPSKTWLKW